MIMKKIQRNDDLKALKSLIFDSKTSMTLVGRDFDYKLILMDRNGTSVDVVWATDLHMFDICVSSDLSSELSATGYIMTSLNSSYQEDTKQTTQSTKSKPSSYSPYHLDLTSKTLLTIKVKDITDILLSFPGLYFELFESNNKFSYSSAAFCNYILLKVNGREEYTKGWYLRYDFLSTLEPGEYESFKRNMLSLNITSMTCQNIEKLFIFYQDSNYGVAKINGSVVKVLNPKIGDSPLSSSILTLSSSTENLISSNSSSKDSSYLTNNNIKEDYSNNTSSVIPYYGDRVNKNDYSSSTFSEISCRTNNKNDYFNSISSGYSTEEYPPITLTYMTDYPSSFSTEDSIHSVEIFSSAVGSIQRNPTKIKNKTRRYESNDARSGVWDKLIKNTSFMKRKDLKGSSCPCILTIPSNSIDQSSKVTTELIVAVLVIIFVLLALGILFIILRKK